MKDLEQKLKNESYVKGLEKSGVKVEFLKKSLKQKQGNKVVRK